MDSNPAQQQQINLDFSLEEVNALLQVLGEMPSKYGVYPIIMKIKTQAESQLNLPEKGSPDA